MYRKNIVGTELIMTDRQTLLQPDTSPGKACSQRIQAGWIAVPVISGTLPSFCFSPETMLSNSVKAIFLVDLFRCDIFGDQSPRRQLHTNSDSIRLACPDHERRRDRAVVVNQTGGCFVLSGIQIVVRAVVQNPVVRTIHFRFFFPVFLEISVGEEFSV